MAKGYTPETAARSGLPMRKEKRRVIKESPHSPLKVGQVVTVRQWGTFGAWDENNNWVDFYCTERV
jgi:hypothetical protein